MTSDSSTAHRVLIAGGGVAGLEALLALRHLAGDRVALTLLAPERQFTYRPDGRRRAVRPRPHAAA